MSALRDLVSPLWAMEMKAAERRCAPQRQCIPYGTACVIDIARMTRPIPRDEGRHDINLYQSCRPYIR